jgi:hypothetical protein
MSEKKKYATATVLDATSTSSSLTMDMEELEVPKYLVYGKQYPIVCKNLTMATRCAMRASEMPFSRGTTFRVFCVSRGTFMAAYKKGQEITHQEKR